MNNVKLTGQPHNICLCSNLELLISKICKMQKDKWLVDSMKDCHLSFSVIPNLQYFHSFSKHRWGYFQWNLRDFCPSIDSLHNYHFDASGSYRYHKTNPNESSGFVQISWRDSIALYNEETDFFSHLNIDHR